MCETLYQLSYPAKTRVTGIIIGYLMELTIEQALQQGVAAHQEGKLQEAERLYRVILQFQPHHPDGNHNLGVLAVSVNKAEAAIPLFKTALEANPKIEQFWLSYIDALIKDNQLDGAKQAIQKAKKKGFNAKKLAILLHKSKGKADLKEPSQVQLSSLLGHYQKGRYYEAEKLARSLSIQFPHHILSWKILGAVLKKTDRLSEAVFIGEKTIQVTPEDAEAHFNFGNTLRDLGRLEEAAVSYIQAIVLKSDYAEAHSNLGITLQTLGRLEEAEASYTQAIALKPDYAEAHNNLAVTLKELGKLDEAEASYIQVISLKPDFAEAHNDLGITLQTLGRLEEAEASYTQAIALKPDYAEAHNNLAVTLQTLGRLEEAEASYIQAIALKPGYVEPHNNLGITLKELGRLEEAEASYIQAIALKPDYAEAHNNLGITLKELGRLDDAEASYKQAIALKIDFAEAHSNLGVTLKELGRLDDAEASYTQAIALKPDLTEAHNNLGITLRELGRLDDAEASYIQAIALKPDYAKAHNNLGITLQDLGRLVEAEASYIQAIALKPDYAEAHNNLGITLKELGRLDDAEASYKQAIALKIDFAEAHSNLGVTLKELGRLDDAEASYTQAIALKPDLTEAHNNLGITLQDLGRLGEAEASYIQAIALKPDFTEAHNNLGITLQDLGRLGEAEASYIEAIALKPDFTEAHNNLGITFKELGRLEDAEASYKRAIALNSDYGEAHNNLGITFKELGRLEDAEASYKRAIALNSDYAEAHNNLGNMLKDVGRLEEAEASLKQAIALKPDYILARDNLLFVLNYDHRLSAAELYREYEAHGAFISSMTTQLFNHSGHPSVAGRRIRIGYSSPDLRSHVCRFFMEPIFREHNRIQFELFAYSNTADPDAHTKRLKGYFDHWVDVLKFSDEAMAQRIYDDGIDILVDMAGHTKGNRLSVFAMRPAPIQVGSAIGYGYTTGLKELHYFIGDKNLTPEGCEPFFSEELWRVPAPVFVYEPPRAETPEVSELPALHNGYVTFGSLTRTVRLNDPLFQVWKVILDRVPGSRLRLDQKLFIEGTTREFFWKRLESLGISRMRVELTYSNPHWDAYKDIDITLDCWPHNAGTTTLESLWMGVPVLSKVDRPSAGCIGAAILKPLGLEAWVTKDEETYVEKAVACASDVTTLIQLRGSLRQRLEQSSLLDAVSHTQNLESAYRQMMRSVMEKKS